MEWRTQLTPERIGLLKIDEEIEPDKKKMLLEILYTREAALIFEWSEIKWVQEKVALLVRICTIPYEFWIVKEFSVSKPLQLVVNKIF